MYFKVISEQIGFNFMENFIQFLTSQKKSDVGIISWKNNMAALRKGQFDVTSNLLGIERLPPQVPGFEVNLKNVTTRGGLPYESDGDARRKIRINTLKETNLGVASALFNS